MLPIIRGADIPEILLEKHHHLARWPISGLEPGDSFQFNLFDLDSVKSSARYHKKKHKDIGWDFGITKIDPLMGQLWRIK